jgi:CubicO group peptidase (beta-lactamase class C family)
MKNTNQLPALLFLCLGLLYTSILSAQPTEARIDSLILTEFGDARGPGGVFMIAKGGKPIYQKAFGKANLEWGTNLTTESVFQLGSMTKQFTAVAVLILAEQGKLRVQDAVSKYVPDYPAGDSITIHHLLTHTSGIKDFTKMKALSEIAQKSMTPSMLVDFFKNEPVDFQPGETFAYNNSGYVLLGHIIELASGETYEAFIEKTIFQKAGMRHSGYASDRKVILNRAYGYQKKETGYVNKTAINFSVPFASGALMSTLGDLLKWQNGLNNQLFLNNETLQEAFKPHTATGEAAHSYGYGWHLKALEGVPVREHGGSIFGFKTMGVYVPSLDVYVVGLTNCDCHSPTQLTRKLAAMAIKAYSE